jgi:hypothetical protein
MHATHRRLVVPDVSEHVLAAAVPLSLDFATLVIWLTSPSPSYQPCSSTTRIHLGASVVADLFANCCFFLLGLYLIKIV